MDKEEFNLVPGARLLDVNVATLLFEFFRIYVFIFGSHYLLLHLALNRLDRGHTKLCFFITVLIYS